MTVGKLYGGILIHENWRNTKFGSIEELRRQEAELEELERAEALAAAEDAAKEVADRGKQNTLPSTLKPRYNEPQYSEFCNNIVNKTQLPL